ncbi:MAG: hypothetical protein KIH10_13325 [Candidatus Freyarchaeota archaeon]|nr:hypothetical protein [Candidatus Jordarchaeia archaeon]MBS7280069.1 hypothetical protein [Candidatus Jordarchaeia archaeon]
MPLLFFGVEVKRKLYSALKISVAVFSVFLMKVLDILSSEGDLLQNFQRVPVERRHPLP